MIFKFVNFFKLRTFSIKKQMSVFTEVYNPITRRNEWECKDDLYDYHQEVANTGFGDMLHDKERNQKYYCALQKTIEKLHKQGQEAHVLDIGTGTGILSMMAVACGADSVTACEAFMPMANCAEKILEANKVRDKINLIKKRSTDIVIGKDMQRKANVLVAEVLDTELIGEGAIGIYNHAHEHLLCENAICIPSKASCYVQIVQSPLAFQWNSLKILANLDGDVLLKPPEDIANCRGEASLHDIQLSQLPLDQFCPITNPFKIFEFDFSGKQLKLSREENYILKSASVGSTDMAFFWWSITMDFEEELKLSCAPFWAHPDFKKLSVKKNCTKPLPTVIPWRDHWMQAIYYISKPLNILKIEEEFILNCNHDEYSFWFDILPKSEKNLKKSIPRQSCTCCLHMTYSRSRIGQMNQNSRNKRYINYLENHVKADSQVLILGDGCVLGLSCAKLVNVSKLWCHEPHRFSRYFIDSLIKFNKLPNVELLEKIEDLSQEDLRLITHIFAEPYFLSSILPWDNFYFGNLIMKIKEKLRASVDISPYGARIYCVPVEFLDLHKIRTPLIECEGFDLRIFDKMVEKSTLIAQSAVEAQPLWEYPCRALASPQQLLQVEFNNFNKDRSTSGKIPIELSASCNGIALWVDWMLDDSFNIKSIVSSGPTEAIEIGNFIKWDMFVRQGVHFVTKNQEVESGKTEIEWKVNFKHKSGQLDFNFTVSHMQQ